MAPLLDIRDLRVGFATEDGPVRPVDGVSLAVERGRALGLVGESGSGKSLTALTIMGLTRAAPAAALQGEVRFDGVDLVAASEAELRRHRGNDIAMVFQDPMSSLHPLFRVGDQIVEAVRAHRSVRKRDARAQAIELLQRVGIPDAATRADAYPHELSGGTRQRVMIAMALVNEPRLLIADEPTTALDVTVQAQILALLRGVRDERGTAIVLVTHDLGVVAQLVDEVAVMYAGRIVERAPTAALFAAPQHPYTWGLLRAIPRLDTPRDAPLVAIEGQPPSLLDPPAGCAFHPRCPYARVECGVARPLVAAGSAAGHVAACVLPPPAVRRELWRALADGATPEQARAQVALPGKALRDA